jgi:hypothetical protein
VVATRAGHLTEVAAALHEMFAALELLSLQSRQQSWQRMVSCDQFRNENCAGFFSK